MFAALTATTGNKKRKLEEDNSAEEEEAEGELQAAIAASAAAPEEEILEGLGSGVAPVHFKVIGNLKAQYKEGCRFGDKPLMFAYLTIRGLGEVPRLMLAEAGASYDHIAVTMAEEQAVSLEWRKRSPTSLMPMVSGLGIPRHAPLSQSSSIIRFLAKRYGFCGTSDLDEARADNLFETAKDLNAQKSDILGGGEGEGGADSAKSYQALTKKLEVMLAVMPGASDPASALNYGQMQLLHVLMQLEDTKSGITLTLSPPLDAFRTQAILRSGIKEYLVSPMRFPQVDGGYKYYQNSNSDDSDPISTIPYTVVRGVFR